jgi:hypothetical protein
MAITIYGGTTIQPLEANFSASQQQTTFVFYQMIVEVTYIVVLILI